MSLSQHRGLWVRDASDRQIVDECTWHYDPGFEAVTWEPSLIIDIGAHIGGFIAEAKKRYSHVRIVGVEPDLGNYLLLKRNAAMPDVELIFGACGTWDGPLWQRYKGGQKQINEEPSGWPWLGDTFSLDSLVTESVDLLKIDCEGGEYNIIPHTSPETWRRIRVIVGEYHGPRTDFNLRALPFLKAYFDISFYPPYNQHVGFFLGVNRGAD